MANQSHDVEILVHVNAPSRVADDAAYRALASAYLAFEPLSHGGVPVSRPDNGSHDEPLARSPTQDQASQARRQGYRGQPPSSSQSIAPIIDSQDLSFHSVLDNRSSPRLRTAAGRQPPSKDYTTPSPHPQGTPSSQNQWSAPPSHISDSYPVPNAAIYASPTRILQSFIRRRPAPESSPASRPSVDLGDYEIAKEPYERDIAIPSSIPDPDRHSDGECPPAGTPAKIVSVTPQLAVAQRKRRHHNLKVPGPDDSHIDVTHISASDLSAAHHEPAEPEPPGAAPADVPPSAQRTMMSTDHLTGLVRHDSAAAAASILRRQPPPAADQGMMDALEARPPSPPVGVASVEPEDLVSPRLARLAVQLSSRYRPEATRVIEPLERGYWLLDCSSWDVERRLEAWAFLASYIGGGQAGWGVWCLRGEDHSWVRLYCWGHLAKHTYLLLYLASERKLKTTGAGWTDAEGDVVLRVPPQGRG
ncbi:hypothetical protein GMORB2_7537 [Geosmithia morbida]|uniref:Uncharacterized protein n=1 Tax=Geosmithia morbida TaxID=1094350 RepID=A0A9P4YV01_9HYPO|nr:uncharacterized protein GMORB2_7537 [Geosmithia morbida]KAF4122545.1 hypothetical protein GMORB2_7537 [Geosmithia morbida]